MSKPDTTITEQIETLEREIEERRQELSGLRQSAPRLVVDDYELASAGGASVRLSELFGGHRDLIVIHNMGSACSYCTLWADGFNGIYEHARQRAGFVVVAVAFAT